MYRHHKRKIQCVRCWLYFKCQNDLDIHLDVENICERQPGQPADGMTPDMEKELRSRKKLPENQNDEDRWASMYRVLFPDAEGVPSPCKSRRLNWREPISRKSLRFRTGSRQCCASSDSGPSTYRRICTPTSSSGLHGKPTNGDYRNL